MKTFLQSGLTAFTHCNSICFLSTRFKSLLVFFVISIIGTLSGNALTGTWTCTGGLIADEKIVTVTTRPTAALSGSTAICNGQSATLSLAVTGAGTLTGTLSNGTAFSGTAPTISVSVSPNSTITYTIATLTDGTSNSIPEDLTGTATVTVNPRPTAGLSGSTTKCVGQSATLSLSVAGTGPITGTLSDGTGFSGTAHTIRVNVSPNSTTVYTIATLTNGTCNSLAVDKAGSATVTMKPLPTVALSGSTTICNGQPATLLLAVTGTGTITGTLSDGTAFSGTAPTITVNVSPTSTTTYTTATLTNGICNSIAADRTGSATVTVNPRLTAALSGSTTVCNGQPATLSLAVTGSGTITGTLSDGTAFSGTAPTITVNVNPASTTPYTIATLTNETCNSIAMDRTGTATVTVNPRPTAALNGSKTICNGQPATLTLAVTGSGTISGILSDGTPFSGVAPAITVSVNPEATTTYFIASLTNGTCAGIAADMTGSVTITVSQPVNITAPPASQTICSSFPVSFSVAATGGGLTYQWYFNGTPLSNTSVISGVTTTTLSISQAAASHAGTYHVVITGAGGCLPVTSGNATLVVNQDIFITSQPIANTICEGTATVIFSVAATGSIADYVWRKNGVPITGAPFIGFNSATLSITNAGAGDAGSYDVVITGTSGTCTREVSAAGTLVVNLNSTLNLTSAGSTTSQTLCISTALAPITHAIAGGGTGASITAGALPAGVTGTYSGGVFTIAGTPTVSGPFFYTVTTTGPCTNISLSGTITVQENATIALTSAAGSDNQTLCIRSSLTNIAYVIGGYGTGASITAGALPAGLTGTYSGGVFTISGSPTASGTFNYTVSSSGPCVNPQLSGTIIVSANSSINCAEMPAPPAPLFTFTEVMAERSTDRSVHVGWKVANAIHIQTYTVERSVDGIYFTGIITVPGTNSIAYTKKDLSAPATGNFYRIKATTYFGQDFYSQVVKVADAPTPPVPSISIYPNPVRNQTLQVKFNNKPVGNYQVALVNNLGQIVFRTTVTISGSMEEKSLNLGPLIPTGIYRLMITKSGDNRYTTQVFIE